MEETSSIQEHSPRLFNINWQAAILYVAFAVSGSGVGGFVATRAVGQSAGISQDQADVRYLSKDEADKRSDKRDKQLDRIEGKLDSIPELQGNQKTIERDVQEIKNLLLKERNK